MLKPGMYFRFNGGDCIHGKGVYLGMLQTEEYFYSKEHVYRAFGNQFEYGGTQQIKIQIVFDTRVIPENYARLSVNYEHITILAPSELAKLRIHNEI